MATNVTPDTFFGGSISFSTLGINSIDILSGSRSAVTVDDIDTTHAGTPVASGRSTVNRTYMPSDLIEGATFDFTVAFDPDDAVDELVGIEDTITITFPVPPGGSTAASVQFEGYINSYGNDYPIDDRMTADISIKVDGDPTFTASS